MESVPGTGISWEIRGDTLYLTGSGDMEFRTRPDGILDIPWYYLDFIHVDIQDGITSIGAEAFHTSDLVDITIPDSVRGIGPLALCKCQDLKTVRLGKGIVSIPEYVFADCVSLSEIELSVESVGYRAFENCSSLSSVRLGEGLKHIGDMAFAGCTSLRSIAIPATVESIEGNPFKCCSSMESIAVADGNTCYRSSDGALFDSEMKRLISAPGKVRVSIPSKTLGIGDYAFAGSFLQSVSLPDNIVTLGVGAFSDCTALETVSIGNLRSVPGEAFSGCTSLQKVDLGMCRDIGPGAFAGCTFLEKIELPDTMESVGPDAFKGTGLTEVAIPDSLLEIGPGAFYGCGKLRKATLPFPFGDEDEYFPAETEIEYLEQ